MAELVLHQIKIKKKPKIKDRGLRVLFVIDGEDFIDPMGPAYLLAAAKYAGHEGDVLILSSSASPFEEIRNYKPHVIAYSAVTGTHQLYFRFNERIREYFPDVFTIMGGSHPTYYPECVKYQPIDAICVGEGEGAFVELLDRLAGGEKGEDLYDIQNLGFPNGPINPKRNLVGDLDTLPLPDRDAIFRKAPRMGNFPLKTFMTSRGCPFPCSYCFEPVLKKMYREEKAFGDRKELGKNRGSSGKYERRHSIDRVVEEILDLKKRWPVEFIKFEDDLFVLAKNDPWLEEFAQRYPKEVGIPFNALVRVDSINEWMAERLKAAGCVSLNISIDAANREVRKRVVHKNFSNEEIIENFHLLKRYGINVFNNMILGLPPTESEFAYAIIADDKDAIDMEIAAGVRFSSRSILMPYPGTEIGKWCEKKGYFKMDVDKFGESLMERSPLNCFSEEQHDVMKNILYLSGLAVWQPWLAPFIKKYAVHWRNPLVKKLYLAIYYVVKVYTLKKYIYPIKIKNPIRGLKDFIKGFWIEVFRAMPEMRKTVTYP
ncbi:MAG: radical SAM protein, partial [Candidatus Azambacteria bacterium]|nr:radical SAM protein [Candidatus Azambacteria bacterium]